MKNSARALFLGVLCLFISSAAAFGDEDIERMLEMYRQSSYADYAQRLQDYETLQAMRRASGERHLPAGSQFDFARQSVRQTRANGIGTDGKGCAWTSAGPTNINGRVISLAIDPVYEQNMYAATVGGLWRSQTGGRKWQRVSDEIMMAQRFSAVAVNPIKTSEVFAGAGDRNLGIGELGNGLWVSNAHGAPGTWTPLGMFNGTIIYRIRIDPSPLSNDVWVAATNGVWRGKRNANGGVDFTLPFKSFNRLTHDLAIDFSVTPRKIYAGVRTDWTNLSKPVGIYKTDSDDLTPWVKRDSGIPLGDAETFSLAISKSNPSILYAKVSQISDQTLIGIFKTTTAAEGVNAWDMLPLGEANKGVPDDIMGWFNTLLEVDPKDPERVFAGGIDMWMSVKGGKEWEKISGGKDPAYHYEAHGDFHTLVFHPDDPKIIYVGNDGGVDRADLNDPEWHWTDSSHGMVISMFNYLVSNRKYPTMLAGGLQDNGTTITFGNRTWYQPGGGDGFDVGSDAGNPNTLYASYNWGPVINLYEMINPIPGLPGGPNPPWKLDTAKTISWDLPKDVVLRPPLITDMDKPKSALAGGGVEPCGARSIYKTTDNIKWVDTLPNFKSGGTVVELASAPSAPAFDTHLAAVAYLTPPGCTSVGVPFDPYVIRMMNGGAWTAVTGLPNAQPTSLSFDPNDAYRSYVTYNGNGMVYMSMALVNNGTYMPIGGSGATKLPDGVRRVVVHPDDSNLLYAATSVGVMRGEVTLFPTPSAKWYAFDEGLPDGMEINELWVDPKTGVLTLGSFGYGVFRRDIRKNNNNCPAQMLVVRDSTYDDGREPSVSVADAENPVFDDPFYKPNNTLGGKAWWWKSRDIRIDVPGNTPYANKIEDADSVEFESCPTPLSTCLSGTMVDSPPEAFKAARVYVQVTNRGVEPATGTRVIVLWNPNAGAFEPLPVTFWTKTFPVGGDCGALDPGTNWQLVDPEKPCRTIDKVTPIMPEVARFDWVPPLGAEGGATMLTIVESPDDLLEKSIREQNILVPKDFVKASRHIALRNVQIHPFDARVREPFLWPLDLLKLPSDILRELEVVVSKPELGESVRIVLPAGLSARAGFGSVRQTRVTEAELVRQLESMRLDPGNAWELSGDEASLYVSLRPGERVKTVVIAAPGRTDAASRVSFLTRSGDEVMGGSELLMRPKH